MQTRQTARPASPLPHTHNRPATSSAHLFVVRKLKKQWSLFNRSPPIGPQVLEVVLCLLLAAILCPARSVVFMCQRALFSRGAGLNIHLGARCSKKPKTFLGKKMSAIRNAKYARHNENNILPSFAIALMFPFRSSYFGVRHCI